MSQENMTLVQERIYESFTEATSRPSWRLWTPTLSGTSLKHLVYMMLASIGGCRQ